MCLVLVLCAALFKPQKVSLVSKQCMQVIYWYPVGFKVCLWVLYISCVVVVLNYRKSVWFWHSLSLQSY